MQRRNALHLRYAASSQLGRARDAHPCLPQPNNAPVQGDIRLTAVVPPCSLGELDALSLALAPGLIVVSCGLKRDAQQHVLHRFEHDARDTGAVSDKLGQIDDAWHG